MKEAFQRRRIHSPETTVLVLVGLMSVLLAGAGIHTAWTLRSLRVQYLENRAQAIARDLLRSLRGPARLGSPDLWRSTFAERLADEANGLVYLGLLDSGGRELVKVVPEGASESASGGEAFVWTQPVGSGRGGPPWREAGQTRAPRQLVVALDPALVAFIDRQVWAHAAVTVSAVLLLWGLAFYLIRLNRRVVALAVGRAEEQHLADLGRMAAVLAHEIRNPLGAMKGLSQLALENLSAGDPSREHLATVVREAGRLEKLVQDLLLFARPRRTEIARTDVTRLVSGVISLLRKEFAARDIALHFKSSAAPVVAETDADGLRQVLLNGLRNAAEASPPGSVVEVVLEGKAREGLLVIEIRDQGPGIGAEDATELFLPFRTSKVREGTGLGLAVAKRIVESLGGRIALENRDPRGAVLRIAVPLAAKPASIQTPGGTPFPRAGQPSVSLAGEGGDERSRDRSSDQRAQPD